MQSAALLVVRKNGGYLGANDRFIDIRVYDAPDPIAELERLLALHKLHFFPSRPEDVVPITPAIVAQLEPMLLREPAGIRRGAEGTGGVRGALRIPRRPDDLEAGARDHVPSRVPDPADLIPPYPTEPDDASLNATKTSANAPIIIRVSGARVPPPASRQGLISEHGSVDASDCSKSSTR